MAHLARASSQPHHARRGGGNCCQGCCRSAADANVREPRGPVAGTGFQSRAPAPGRRNAMTARLPMLPLLPLLVSVERIAREAGALILEVYTTAFEVRAKGDASPVTEADERAERCIDVRLELER